MRLSLLIIFPFFMSSTSAQKAIMYSTTHADRWVKSTIKMQTATNAEQIDFEERLTNSFIHNYGDPHVIGRNIRFSNITVNGHAYPIQRVSIFKGNKNSLPIK